MAVEPITPPTGVDDDEAPKVERPPKRERSKASTSGKLKEQLAELYINLGLIVVTPIDRLGGMLLVSNAEEIAEQWVQLAETNPKIKKALLKLVEAGGWGGLVIAHGMVLMPVLANRGMFPDQAAAGIATVTMLQNPETAEMFTHPGFQETNGNGNSAAGL